MGATEGLGLVERVMAMIDVGSRMKSSATLIGEEEGDHDDDRDTLNTAFEI